MAGHGSKFERKKEAAIAALLTTKNYEEAAQATGIDLKTLKRWMRLPEFESEYLLVRREAMVRPTLASSTTPVLWFPWVLSWCRTPRRPPPSRRT